MARAWASASASACALCEVPGRFRRLDRKQVVVGRDENGIDAAIETQERMQCESVGGGNLRERRKRRQLVASAE